MTLYLYTGTPGSGKSLHMAKQIYWNVRMHRPTICNFGIDTALFKDASSFVHCPNEGLNPSFLADYADRVFATQEFQEGKIKLFIDEAQVIFGNRDWREQGRKEWVRFFTQHRKMGYDVYMVAQNHEMIDKQIRSLVEYEVQHRKLNNSGWVGFLANCLLLGNPAVCAVTRWYGMRMRLSSEWLLGTKRTYRIYDTRQVFQQFE